MSDAAKQIDLLWRDANNKAVSIEIAGSADHEVHNAINCLGHSEVRKHVVVAVDKKVLEQVKKKFAGFSELAKNDRIEIVTLAQALSETWVP